ncbi:hypothetical protein [Mesorhizobium sp. M1136]|uniref:hypothetical protein n=1 Tax=Mesorhizobium sp. M1136 TaxID=2957059 RepID=UPI00333B6D10
MKILEPSRFGAWQHVRKLHPGDFQLSDGRWLAWKREPVLGNSVCIGVGAIIITTPGHMNPALAAPIARRRRQLKRPGPLAGGHSAGGGAMSMLTDYSRRQT